MYNLSDSKYNLQKDSVYPLLLTAYTAHARLCPFVRSVRNKKKRGVASGGLLYSPQLPSNQGPIGTLRGIVVRKGATPRLYNRPTVRQTRNYRGLVKDLRPRG